MEKNVVNFRNGKEKRQDAFEDLIKNASVGIVAKIRFEGNIFQVEKIESLSPKVSKLKIIGNRHGLDGDILAFNINVETDAELLKVLKL